MYNDTYPIKRKEEVNSTDSEFVSLLQGRRQEQWRSLLERTGLHPGAPAQLTLLIWDGEELAATASRDGNILKYIAVDPAHQGEDLTASLMTQLRQEAFSREIRHLFLYTKPGHQQTFRSLFFYPVACTQQVLLMENRENGAADFVSSLAAPRRSGTIGAAVMNCNPFTKGHRYLIEQAARRCDWLYVFVLSEEQRQFPAAHRLRLVQEGTADLPNVTVHPTGPYLISSATFPSYFLKEPSAASQAQCQLDIEIFSRYFVPAFGITHRFVGEEPFSPITAQYNEALCDLLPRSGVQVEVLPRLTQNGTAISASAVRALLTQGKAEPLRALVPECTYQYLCRHYDLK